MQLQISENAITAPALEFEECWFRTISNESKVAYIQNLKDKPICWKYYYKKYLLKLL